MASSKSSPYSFSVEEIALNNSQQVQAFLDLPFFLYRDQPQWVPPLQFEARAAMNPARNAFFQHSQAAFFLATNSTGSPIGRLAVLDHQPYNRYNQSRTAFFYLFESIQDVDVARSLFEKAATWARSRNLFTLFGPKGFSSNDGMGLLTRGFEHRPAFGIPYNYAYYPQLLDAVGFVPDTEVVSGYLHRSMQFPEKIHRLADKVKQRRGLTIARFKRKRDLRRLVPSLRDLYNSALGGTQGNVPMSEHEAQAIASQMLWFADPRLIKIVMKDDQPVGFMFAYPDISAALQHTGGRLWPWGWFHVWRELAHTRWLNINGAGMVESYRGLGGTALLFSELYKTVVDSRFEHADLVQIGLENQPMQRELRKLGVDFYKAHQMYTLTLT
ncbi:MAG: hypothetical protein PVF49_08835 [Anaerolineales bacterium]|jgi:hypothetical protein